MASPLQPTYSSECYSTSNIGHKTPLLVAILVKKRGVSYGVEQRQTIETLRDILKVEVGRLRVPAQPGFWTLLARHPGFAKATLHNVRWHPSGNRASPKTS